MKLNREGKYLPSTSGATGAVQHLPLKETICVNILEVSGKRAADCVSGIVVSNK